jgi:hypothetical protein
MKHERQKKKILGRNLGRDWTHYLLLIALLLVSPNFQSCTRGQKTEGNLFRIVDHFETLNFHETAIDSSVLMQGPKDAKTPLPSLLDPDLEKFIMENLNWDNTNGSPVHPFKLKIKKRPAKGSERGLRSKNAILAPPPTSFSFTRKISKNASLEFGYGIVNDNWENVIGEVSFTIDITDIKIQTKQRLFQTTLNPELRDMDKQWFAEEIDLGEYAKRNVTITFSTSSENAGTNNCYAAWVNPLLRTKENKQLKINVILISMDTLRADHLGCYGYTRDTTPNLDAISKESVLFKQVVAQAPYTVSSHMSMLTSLYPSFHKVNLIQKSTLLPKSSTTTGTGHGPLWVAARSARIMDSRRASKHTSNSHLLIGMFGEKSKKPSTLSKKKRPIIFLFLFIPINPMHPTIQYLLMTLFSTRNMTAPYQGALSRSKPSTRVRSK